MSPEEITLARSQHPNLAFFTWIDQPAGPVRLFAGAGDWALDAANTVDSQGEVYVSAGVWNSGLFDIDMVMNGGAQGVAMQREATSQAEITALLSDRANIIGARAALGWGILDERFRLAGPVRWPIRGQLFKPQLARSTQGGVTTRMIGVTLMTSGYLRRRAAMAWQTDESQRERDGDMFYARIQTLSASTTRVWPS